MKKKTHLELYYKWLKQGHLDGNSGLCKAYWVNKWEYRTIYCIFDLPHSFWDKSKKGDFNGIRQNMVLLMAAIDNEF